MSLDDAYPDHIAVDETVIQLNDKRFRLYAAVDPHTNRLLYITLFPTRNQAITEMFLAELRDKHLVNDALFLVDSAPWSKPTLHRHSLDSQYEKHGNRNRSDVFFEIQNIEPTSSQTISVMLK